MSDRTNDPLALPPPSRTVRVLTLVAVFLIGAGLTAFAITNPLGLSFLPDRTAAPAPAADDGPKTLYQCPMHPEVIEDHPSDCPICGMPLVAMDTGGGQAAPASVEREVLYWYAPMDPSYVRDDPGLSPMGMELVPKYAEAAPAAAGDPPGTIRIDPVQVQNTGVVSVPVARREIARTVRASGILDFDAEGVTWVNVKYGGWIEEVHVNYVGQEVAAGQPLFEIYSPELVTTQQEYLRALEYRDALRPSASAEARRQAEGLLRAARERLSLWDIDDDQIAELEARREPRRRLVVRSPASGIVASVMDEALEGMRVTAGMNLYKIADLSTIWVHADVHEADLGWIREGRPADVSFRFEPRRTVRGRVLFLYPQVSRETRTLKICVEIPNPDRRLRAGMYAEVTIAGPPVRDALVIPDSAVLRSGTRELVFVDLGDGRFAPREVTLGVSGKDGRVQVLDGLADGEAVVTQAQFMLDSESRVQEAIAKFMARGTAAR